jgi:disease resistance protein RPM1
MDLVTGALGKLPSKLLELLRDEYKLQTGVKDQIRRLTRELESMHAALRKLAQVPPDELDELVLLWARDVREAS